MKERLLEYLKYRKIGQNAFEDQCGISQGTINKINHGIRSDKLALIAKACPDLNLRWLLLGEGCMLLGNSNASSPVSVSSVNMENVQAVFITNVDAIASAVAKVLGGK